MNEDKLGKPTFIVILTVFLSFHSIINLLGFSISLLGALNYYQAYRFLNIILFAIVIYGFIKEKYWARHFLTFSFIILAITSIPISLKLRPSEMRKVFQIVAISLTSILYI